MPGTNWLNTGVNWAIKSRWCSSELDLKFQIKSRPSARRPRQSCVSNGHDLHVGDAIPKQYQEQLKEVYDAAKIMKNPKVFVSNLQQALQMSSQVGKKMENEV